VRYRNKIIINEVKVQNTNYTGIWLWDVKNSQINNAQLINCSWGSTGYSSGALNLGNLERVEISQLTVDENTGYGVKAIGPDGYNNIFYLKIHDSHVSVAPFGLWNNGTAPNIAIELWQSTLLGCEIYNNYVDNNISLVNSAVPATGIQTIRVHHNTLDMATRANGAGYGVELSIHDAEIDHNYFIKGNYGIANWTNPMKNWIIHHNIFYAVSQAVFLIFCFRWRDLEEDLEDTDELLGASAGKKWMSELSVMQRVVTSPLNPLKVLGTATSLIMA